MIVVYQSTVQKGGKPEPACVLELLTVQKHSQMHTHVLKLNCAVKCLYLLLTGQKLLLGMQNCIPNHVHIQTLLHLMTISLLTSWDGKMGCMLKEIGQSKIKIC